MTSNETQTIPARLELDALIRYEMSKLGLWRAICKRSPQLALFEEVYGDSPDSGAEWVSYSTSDTLGEPVRLLERRTNAHKWCRTVLGRMGLTAMSCPGQVASVPSPPWDADASAPSHLRAAVDRPDGSVTSAFGVTRPENPNMDVDRPRPHDQEIERGRGQKEQQ